jgi:hypothetical protein
MIPTVATHELAILTTTDANTLDDTADEVLTVRTEDDAFGGTGSKCLEINVTINRDGGIK